MSSAPELKPCPFCGGEAIQLRPSDSHCSNEGCAGWMMRHCPPEKWNTRTDIADARVAALVAERDAAYAKGISDSARAVRNAGVLLPYREKEYDFLSFGILALTPDTGE